VPSAPAEISREAPLRGPVSFCWSARVAADAWAAADIAASRQSAVRQHMRLNRHAVLCPEIDMSHSSMAARELDSCDLY
jgi:hypothetical protein